MRWSLWCVNLAVGLAVASNVDAQQPFVDGLFLSGAPHFQLPGPADFTDIPATVKALSVPAGKAVITWSVGGNLPSALIRPAIGSDAPTDGFQFGFDANQSGSWTTHTNGGMVNVRLQVKVPASQQYEISDFYSVTWSLVVFPDSTEAPAMGIFGVVILAVSLAIAGGMVLAKRPGFRDAE